MTYAYHVMTQLDGCSPHREAVVGGEAEAISLIHEMGGVDDDTTELEGTVYYDLRRPWRCIAWVEPVRMDGRFSLEDTNPSFYNCGHYPEWIVRSDPTGRYASRAEAEAAADRRNDASDRRWQHFLNG